MADEITKDTITIGDKIYDKDSVTPSAYFEYVKGLKEKLDTSEYDAIIDQSLKMLQKTKITGQTEMAKEITHQIDLAIRELDAAKAGFDIYINRKDIERYIESVDSKVIKIIELKNYTREIPDSVIDKITKAREIFDQLYIIFTDYTTAVTKKVAEDRRDKDPIVFGAFIDKSEDKSYGPYVEDRLFFIADWVEEKCDLTLEQICRDIKKSDDKEITYKVTNPKTEEEIKQFLKSFSEHIENQKPVSIFTKIKKTVKKTSAKAKTATSRRRKNISHTEDK